jgi:hypothetical protein
MFDLFLTKGLRRSLRVVRYELRLHRWRSAEGTLYLRARK